MVLSKSAEPQGRVLLMEAALRLAERTRSVQALGIREIGREAGLNPNTFYRHFKDLDDLGLAIIENIVHQLRQPLRELRVKAAAAVGGNSSKPATPLSAMGFDLERARQISHETVKLFFDFVAEYPGAFFMGVRELHGASPVLRQTLRAVMADFASDMAEDMRVLNMLPMLDDEALNQLSSITIREMFQLSMEYIEHPDQREAVCQQAESMIVMLLIGAVFNAKLPVRPAPRASA